MDISFNAFLAEETGGIERTFAGQLGSEISHHWDESGLADCTPSGKRWRETIADESAQIPLCKTFSPPSRDERTSLAAACELWKFTMSWGACHRCSDAAGRRGP